MGATVSERRQDRVRGGRQAAHRVRCTEAQEAELQKLAARRGGMSIPKLLVQSTLSTQAGSDLFRREAATRLLRVIDTLDRIVVACGCDVEVQYQLDALTGQGSDLAWLADQLAMPDGRSRRR